MQQLQSALRWWRGWPHRARAEGFLAAALVLIPLDSLCASLWRIWGEGARGPATDGAMGADFTTLTFLLLLGLYALCSRTIRALPAAALWFAAWLLGEGFFLETVHRILVRLSAYPEFLIPPHQTEANPNFAKLLCLLIVGVLLLVMVCRRRTRSFDRIFVALMFWSVYSTTFLFHWVTLTGIREARVQGELALRLIAEAPAHFVGAICEAGGARCFTGRVGEALSPTGDAVLDAHLKRQLTWLAQRPPGLPSNVVDWSNDRRSVFSLVGHLTHDGQYRFAVDTVRYREIIYLYQGVYAALANAAHLLWLGGGFYLMAWHRRRLRARVKNQSRTLS